MTQKCRNVNNITKNKIGNIRSFSISRSNLHVQSDVSIFFAYYSQLETRLVYYIITASNMN